LAVIRLGGINSMDAPIAAGHATEATAQKLTQAQSGQRLSALLRAP